MPSIQLLSNWQPSSSGKVDLGLSRPPRPCTAEAKTGNLFSDLVELAFSFIQKAQVRGK